MSAPGVQALPKDPLSLSVSSNTVYYQAIEFAINHKLRWVEAGAQGPHKIQRGYLPRKVYSAHWIQNKNFREAVKNFLDQERREVEFEISELMKFSPYRSIEND